LDEPKERAAVFVVAAGLLLCVAGAIAALRAIWTAPRDTVTLSPTGVRIGEGRELAWREIASVRSVRSSGNVALVDRSELRLATINGTISGLTLLIDEIVDHLPFVHATSLRIGNRRPLVYPLMGVEIIGALIAVIIMEKWFVWLLLVPVLVWEFYTDMRDEIREVEIEDDRLTLRSFLRSWSYERGEIDWVFLVMTPTLSVRVNTVRSGVLSVVAYGADPLDVYRLIRDGTMAQHHEPKAFLPLLYVDDAEDA